MRKILPGLLVAIVLSYGSIASGFIKPEEAQQHLGEVQTVCGTVASAHYAFRSKGQPTFLNLDQPYPDQIFTILIWGTDRAKFPQPPESYFNGKSICVTGTIKNYRGTPEIVAHGPSQIK